MMQKELLISGEEKKGEEKKSKDQNQPVNMIINHFEESSIPVRRGDNLPDIVYNVIPIPGKVTGQLIVLRKGRTSSILIK